MPTLPLNRPFETRDPNVVVENDLVIGRHRFALVVVDEDGNESAPVQHVVEVRRAIITPLEPIVGPVSPP
jgi:hypothetical protein